MNGQNTGDAREAVEAELRQEQGHASEERIASVPALKLLTATTKSVPLGEFGNRGLLAATNAELELPNASENALEEKLDDRDASGVTSRKNLAILSRARLGVLGRIIRDAQRIAAAVQQAEREFA